MLTFLKETAARVRALFRPHDFDRDFEQELESHLAMLTEDNVRRGMPPGEARRAALIRMGGPQSIREQHRAVRGLPAVESVLRDIRFAFRLIAKNRGFSAAAIVVLALGIGANTIGFTIVNAAFLRGLPFKDSNRLYMLAWQPRSGSRLNLSYAELEDLRVQSRTVAGIAAFSNGTMNLSDDRAMPEEARATRLTANAFGVLGQQPLLGRDFAPADDRPGADPVAIINYRMWKNRYGAGPDVLGKSIRLNGQPATIIGVMPDSMNFPGNTEVWVPAIPPEAQQVRNQARALGIDGQLLRQFSRPLNVFGRLRDGATRAEAQTELNGVAQRLAMTYPDTHKDLVGARVETFTERYVGGPARIVFLTMMAAVSFVLFIACANVANLLVSRSAHRAREIALRIALGATRWRVVRQLLLESVVLGCIGGSIGLLLAIAGVRALDAAVQDPERPFWIIFSVDYGVFGYVAAICVLTGILFGLVPALHVSKTSLNDVLKEGGRGSTGSRRVRWLSGLMVVTELALTIVLLAGAGLMVRSFMKLYTLDIGARTDHLMVMRMQLPATKYATPEARRAFFERLEPRLAAIPGVESIAVTTSAPPSGAEERSLEIEGRPARNPEEQPQTVSIVTISPRFFDVVAVQMRRGRTFHERDGAPGAETVIINERMAAQFFPGEDPMGTRIRFPRREPTPGEPAPLWRTIVGISPSLRHGARRDGEANPVVYLPYRQDPSNGVALVVRSELPPGSVMHAVRREVQAIDPDQPVFTIQTLDQMLAQERWPFRVFGGLFAIFAGIALVLSSVGLYAVMAHSVAQRTQEIGVRMALGAEGRQMSWLILKRGLVQLAMGLTLGLAGAFALSRVLRTVLFQITPTDPVTFAAITMLLTVVSIAACLLPARRATRVDPVVALRAE
jgi:putative ABC transport system permease protein